jgi:hypothetical protein
MKVNHNIERPIGEWQGYPICSHIDSSHVHQVGSKVGEVRSDQPEKGFSWGCGEASSK